MKKYMLIGILAIAMSTGLPGTGWASIVYVDAVEGASGNTFATGGSLSDTSWRVTNNASSVINDKWDKRLFGNDGALFQGMMTVDQIPELTTQITGLADGQYDVWVFYWDQVTNATQNWTISAGLESGNLVIYSSPGQPAVPGATTAGVTYAGDLAFTTGVMTDDTIDRQLFGVNLGTVNVTGGSSIDVFVDAGFTTGSLNRVWYDGVGYEAVPEPATLALLSMGGLTFLRKRK